MTNCFVFIQVTIYQCEAKGVVKLLQAYVDADVSFTERTLFFYGGTVVCLIIANFYKLYRVYIIKSSHIFFLQIPRMFT